MYFKPAGPLTMSGVLAATWKLYRLSFRHCWPLALLSVLQSSLLEARLLQPARALALIWADAVLNDNLHAVYVSTVGFARAFGAIILASGLLSALLLAAMMITPLALAAGQSAVSPMRSLAVAASRLPWIVLGSALTLMLTGVGLVLLVVPGIYWWGRVQLWFVPVLGEGASAPRAIGRSWELTRGHWWRVSTLLSVALSVGWLGTALGGFLASLLRIGVAPAGLLAMLIGNFALVFTLPYLAAMLVVVYDDLEMHAVLANARAAAR